jgi:hypothetical protein
METQTMVGFFKLKKSSTRSWLLDWKGYFEQGIKWDAPLNLSFGLGLWRLHTMPGQRLHILYFIGYFQSISLDSKNFGHSIPRPGLIFHQKMRIHVQKP